MWKIDLDKINFKTALILFVLFFMISFCIYYPALWGGAIWDDIYRFFGKENWFGEKATISFFWENSFRWPVFESIMLILKWIFNTNHFAYHIVNIIFYSINAVIYFFILKKLNFKNIFLISLLYFVHPMNVQNVAWIIQFKSILSTTFLLLTIYGFIDYVKLNKNRYLYIAMLSFILMLLTKSFLIQLPFFMFFSLYYLKYSFKENLKKTFSFFILSFIYLMYFLNSSHFVERGNFLEQSKQKVDIHSTNLAQQPAPINKKIKIKDEEENFAITQEANNLFVSDEIFRIKRLEQIDAMQISKERKLMLKLFFETSRLKKMDVRVKLYKRLAHMGQIFNYYLFKMIFPNNLRGFYTPFKRDFSQKIKNHILFYLSALVFLFIVFLNFLFRNNGVNALLVILTFVSMLPVSGIIKAPFMSITDVSDHHMFVPLLFFIPLIVNVISKYKYSLKILSVVVLFFSAQTFNYSKTFKDSEAFYKNVLKYSPDHMLAYLNLGHYYKIKKEYAIAYKTFKQGSSLYRKMYPDLFKYADVDAIYKTAPYTSHIYYSHPVFDPYFLLIERHLASFVPVTEEKYYDLYYK